MQAQRTRPEPAPEQAAPAAPRSTVELADDILDDIDRVLEETALQAAYIQRNGQ